MPKTKPKKGRVPARSVPSLKTLSAEAQELRALLRRVPDGFQATLAALRTRPEEARERVLTELARGVGKDVLPLFRSAALGADEGLALSALRVLPVFGTRAAADVLVEVHDKKADTDRAQLAAAGAAALQAMGISIAIGGEAQVEAAPRLTLRETLVSAPDGVGSRSVTARLQDQYGVWHSIFVLWNDQAGIRDGFLRQMSRAEWAERQERAEERGLGWVPCPTDYARWQVAQGVAVSAALGEDVESHVVDFHREVGLAAADYTPPTPWEDPAALPEDEYQALLNGAGCLIGHTEAGRWFLEAADCEGEARRLGALWGADHFEAALDPVLRDAVAALMTPPVLDTYRSRLEDLARVCAWRADPGHARLAAVAAFAIAKGTPPQEIDFCRRLVVASLKVTLSLLARGEDLEKHRWRAKRFAPKRG
jgi:hypothetical protein